MMKVTVRELVEASEKNGYKWAKSSASGMTTKVGFKSDPACTIFSCVVGQGLANIANNDSETVTTNAFPGAGKLLMDQTPLEKAFAKVYDYNDNHATSYADAVEFMKKCLAPFYDEVIEIR